METKTISFYTLGCRLNQSETAVLINLFAQNRDYCIVNSNEPSEISVINTCTVTKNSDSDTRKLINRIVRSNPKSSIALIGCQSQVQKKELSVLPNIKWIVGNENKFKLTSILSNKSHGIKVIVPDITRRSFTVPIAGIDNHHKRANMKIQDGCDSFCSFCEVPYARGPSRSRKFSDIIHEAKILANAGHKELVLTGINIGTYKYGKNTIVEVINALEQIAGIERIRISSIEPSQILDKILVKMSKKTKLCRHLHIPIQSASNNVLKLMGRKYTSNKILKFIEKAYNLVPDICIGADIIVGFPGESDKYFDETYINLCNAQIQYFHVFSYSERNLAKSKDLPNKVDIKIIKKRSELLRKLGQSKREVFYNSQLGKTYQVLFEQLKQNYWFGLTDNYIHVLTKSRNNLENQIVNIRLKDILKEKTIGQLIANSK